MKRLACETHPEDENRKSVIAQAMDKIPVDTYAGRVYEEILNLKKTPNPLPQNKMLPKS